MMKHIFCLLLLVFAFQAGAQKLHDRYRDLPCKNEHFRIVAYYIQDSLGMEVHDRATLDTAVQLLNEYFAPICVTFEACSREVVSNYAYVIMEKDEEIQDLKSWFYSPAEINLYLGQEARNFQNAITPRYGAYTDSLRYSYIANRTANRYVHEIGHLFGLENTNFFDGDMPDANDIDCEITGDSICDTPPDPFLWPGAPRFYVDENCVFNSMVVDSRGQFYQPDVGNVMSEYVMCTCGFSRGQLLKIAERL